MSPKSFHISDRELLLCADNELSAQRAGEVRKHLNACWTCRARTAALEQTIGDFVHLYREELDTKIPPIDGPRALLKAQMAQRANLAGVGSTFFSRMGFSRIWLGRAGAALAAAFLVAGAALTMWLNSKRVEKPFEIGAIPNVRLTPGAINPGRFEDVCRAGFAANDPAVPDPLKREVLKEYGLSDASNNAYEIDYLVTPQLGGVASINNLWPEPSLTTVWNARVKDALEDRLHDLVCSGQLDLATAQREISQNWIAAYKKYFHTNQPLST
jgi:hypothetical protein